MKNLAFKKDTIQHEKRSLALVDFLDSADINTDKAWFKNFVKSIFETNDLNLETFDRIEMKKKIQSENDYFN